MTEQEEKYLHFAYCIDDLNYAWRLLQEIRECKGNSLVGAAFQFALIQYSKPYKCSYGSVLNSKGKTTSYKLDESHIPTKHIELHRRIINARDQIHAHSDLTVKEAKLYISDTSHGKTAIRGQNKILGTEELSNIDAVIDLIEESLNSMYEKAKQSEAELPITF
ncbi:MAG: hypothetical protein KME12_00540 [Trichocoleus desertorum ATA4-8-CV12]|nr:hypothetical protein [Trichocoleus desertorum ATA4-8-CV12]